MTWRLISKLVPVAALGALLWAEAATLDKAAHAVVSVTSQYLN